MLANCRVLIIEEEVLIALDIQRALEGTGVLETVLARSPADVRGMAQHWPAFDLALMDARMGSRAAVALASELDAAGVAVVVASADSGTASLFPRATLLAKPYGEETLLAACHSALAANGPSIS